MKLRRKEFENDELQFTSFFEEAGETQRQMSLRTLLFFFFFKPSFPVHIFLLILPKVKFLTLDSFT